VPAKLFDALLERWQAICPGLLRWSTAGQAAVKFEAVYSNLDLSEILWYWTLLPATPESSSLLVPP
jgi:hypothetical protein